MQRVGALAAAVVAAVAVVILAGRAHIAPSAAPSAALPEGAIQVDVGFSSTGGDPIPPGFVGLSTEFASLTAYAGDDPGAVNPLFVRLVQNLAPGARPLIRIGGDTTDWTWWPLPGRAKPPWAKYVLTPRWIAVARAVANAAHAKLILGINFEADSRSLAGAESGALVDGIGRQRIAALELGNEPEVYGQIGWYADAAGAPVLGRAPSYGFRAFLRDFHRIAGALPGGVPVAGPALALTWPLTVAGRFLSANPWVGMFTFHFYPLKRCFNARSSATFPTLAHLLATRSAAPPPGVAGAASAAHSRGVEVRVDEFNSVSCRGLPGLSDTFASALWAPDALFGLAQAGVDGVNIHTLPGVSYEPFAFARAAGRWEASVKPIYYGLLLFARAAPAGSRLLPTSHPRDAALRTWATRSAGTVRVLLINESPTRRLKAAVRLARFARRATLERLVAPGLTATSGITLGGITYGKVTTTGSLSGKRSSIVLQPVRGRYVVALPPASAAVLTVRG